MEYGKARFKCRHCGCITTVEIKEEVEHTQRAPRREIIPRARA